MEATGTSGGGYQSAHCLWGLEWQCAIFVTVDTCVPGDIVTVSGTVKVNSIDEGRGKNKEKCMFLLYLHANSINNTKATRAASKSGSNSSGSGGGMAMEFSMKELYAIQEIQSEPHLFRLLIGWGHSLICLLNFVTLFFLRGGLTVSFSSFFVTALKRWKLILAAANPWVNKSLLKFYVYTVYANVGFFFIIIIIISTCTHTHARMYEHKQVCRLYKTFNLTIMIAVSSQG